MNGFNLTASYDACLCQFLYQQYCFCTGSVTSDLAMYHPSVILTVILIDVAKLQMIIHNQNCIAAYL
jgi:hypothetical protein